MLIDKRRKIGIKILKASSKKKGPRQASFFDEQPAPRFFGGSHLKGNPKVGRRLSTKEPIHLVLKSERAFGPQSMLQKYNVGKIDKLVRRQAAVFGLKIYHFVNVGNHLHLVIRLHDVKLFAKFIRAITGLIARHVLHQERGQGLKFSKTAIPRKASPRCRKKFWVARPFTRLIAWGCDYKNITRYMAKNRNQAKGFFVAWGFDITDPRSVQNLETG